MKWLVFVPALFASIALGAWLRRHPAHRRFALGLAGLLAFVQPGVPELKLALVGWPEFPGYTHGLEVTALDLCALALVIGLPRSRARAPLLLTRLFYFVAVCLSILQAQHPFAASFVAWQVARMYVFFAAVVRGCELEEGPSAALVGMGLGVVATGLLALGQRYLMGYHEVRAAFDHQNEIGLACNFVTMPALALLLAQRTGWVAPAALLFGTVAVILSLSRGSLLLMGVGFGTVFALSALRRFTVRKVLVALVVLLVAGGLTLKAFTQLEIRFSTRTYGVFGAEEQADERAKLERASALILREHPLGVGANHFSTELHGSGYVERAQLLRHAGVEGIVVHNLYWLTAVESGYLGLVALLALLARLLALSLYRGWRARGDVRGDVLLGLSVAMMTFMGHGLVEWVHVTRDVQYVFWLSAGMAVSLARQVEAPPRSG